MKFELTAGRGLQEAKAIGGQMKKAYISAINRTAQQVVTHAARAITDEYNLKSAEVKQAMRISKAAGEDLRAVITVRSRRLGLIKFAARQTRAGVSAMVKKGQRKVVRGAFITQMKSGHTGVFQRLGKSRLPIKELMTISIPEMFRGTKVQSAVETIVRDRLPKNINDALNHFVK